MALETGTYISDMVITNPASTDQKSQGDDHIRLLKSTITATFPNITGAMTSTHTELNILDGATVTTAELNILDGVTSTAVELNLLDGVTATTTEINYVDGVTSNIQTQLDAKADITGETYSGTHNYTGAVINVANQSFGASGSAAANLDFVNAVALSAALPGQSGNAGKLITTDGSSASWSATINAGVVNIADGTDATKKIAIDASGITTATTRTITMPDKDITLGGEYGTLLLSTVVASGAASADIEWTAGEYDAYVIVGSNITASSGTATQMLARFKLTGAYVTTSTYEYTVNEGNPGVGLIESNALTQPYLRLTQAGPVSTATYPTSTNILINNPDNSDVHQIKFFSSYPVTANHAVSDSYAGNTTAGVLTGIRIYMFSGNISGTFRLYGIRNS